MLAPYAAKEQVAGRHRYKLPATYCRLRDCINIQRVGPPAKKNAYICRVEGCSWHREAVTDAAARLHAKSHSETKKCHIFEGHLSAEQLAAQKREKNSSACKRYRERQKQLREAESAKKARTVRTNALLLVCPVLSESDFSTWHPRGVVPTMTTGRTTRSRTGRCVSQIIAA